MLTPSFHCARLTSWSATDVNPRFFAICGHPPSRAIKDWRDAVLAADRPALDSFYDAALATGTDQAVEFESLEVRFNHRDDAWGQFGTSWQASLHFISLIIF